MFITLPNLVIIQSQLHKSGKELELCIVRTVARPEATDAGRCETPEGAAREQLQAAAAAAP